MHSFNRRDFLRVGAAGALIAPFVSSRALAEKAAGGAKLERGRARNVIFMVSDGMSLGTLVLAERFSQINRGRSTNWIGAYAKPGVRRALMDTASANSLVTDSAAASSSWGCGQRVRNGSINVTADERPLTPIFHHARAAGVATGLVTTATVTHATPAGFVAQVPARATEREIALQYLNADIDLVLGGGSMFFDAAVRPDKRDLFAEFAKKDYLVVRDRSALLTAPEGKRLLGVFDSHYLPYSLDREADAALKAKVPTLAEMATVALKRLEKAPNGFLVQIEGGRIDHGAHRNDVGALIFDQLAFDEAVGVVLEWVSKRDDTMVVITSDHANANPGLCGVGGSFESKDGAYGLTGGCFAQLAKFRRTNTWVMEGIKKDTPAKVIQERILEASGVTLTKDQMEIFQRALKKQHHESYAARNVPTVVLGNLLANHVSIGWAGTAHTSDFTELAAFGPGSETVGGVMLNTSMFGLMRGALGV